MGKRGVPEPSRIRKAVFGSIAVAAFFGGVELLLFAAGVKPVLYAEDPYVGFSSQIPLFAAESGEDGEPWMATARNKLAFFNPQRFPQGKRPGTFRVFCLGDSTTYGHPYSDPTSFCGWLREFLPAADPRHKWEVINAGGISYASYRVALLMEELVRYEPDLFLVYAGHNEFLERRTYAGLLESPPIVRGLDAWLSRSRTYSVISRAIRSFRPQPAGPAPQRDLLPAEVETLLEHSVGPEAYQRDDELRDKVLAHFRFNLARMVDIARSAGAGVMLIAPASNLGDCSPFKSEPAAGRSEAERARWTAGIESAGRAYRDGRYDEALAAVERALAIDDRQADAHYLRGRVLEALGRFDDALAAYVRARDEDVCPLRALTPVRGIVAEVARERGVPWVDFNALVERRAEHGIPGEESFLDHVHPTIEVYRLLALAILERMQQAGIVHPGPGWGTETVQRIAQEVEGRIDRGAHATALRTLANVLAWAGKLEEAERLARQAAELQPEDATVHNQLGVTLADQGRTPEAEAQFRRALAIDPDFAEANNNLGVILEGRAELAAAAEHYARAARSRPDYVDAQDNLAIVLMRLGRADEAERVLAAALRVNPDHVRARCSMARLLVERGDLEGAQTHLERALRFDPQSVEAHNNMGIVRYRQGRLDEARVHFEQAVQIAPGAPEGYNNLGAIYERQGDLTRALAEYERAVAADPNHADAVANRARVQTELGSLAAAVER